jgi:hypothetical protein
MARTDRLALTPRKPSFAPACSPPFACRAAPPATLAEYYRRYYPAYYQRYYGWRPPPAQTAVG